MRLATPRVPPLTLPELDDAQRELVGKSAVLGDLINVVGTLVRYPELFKRWSVFANHLLFKSTLPVRAREIVILRTGWHCRCEYEWAQHVKISADDAGFGPAEWRGAAEGAGAAVWTAADKALIRAVDELFATTRMSDAAWADLTAHYDTKQCFDIVFGVGNYILLAAALNSLGVQVDKGYTGFEPGLPLADPKMPATLQPMGVPKPEPRVAPVEEADWTPAQRELMEKSKGPHPDAAKVFKTFANHPDLTRRWYPFFLHCLHKSSLSARDREVIIMRMARLGAAEYEWAQHVSYAKDAGLDEADLRRIVQGQSATGWTGPNDALIVRACDELFGEIMLSDRTWVDLNAVYDLRQILDLIFIVGQYRIVALAANTTSVQLDPWIKPYAL